MTEVMRKTRTRRGLFGHGPQGGCTSNRCRKMVFDATSRVGKAKAMDRDRLANTAREADAFSRRARRIVPFARGELRKLKRALAKRARRNARSDLRSDE